MKTTFRMETLILLLHYIDKIMNCIMIQWIYICWWYL